MSLRGYFAPVLTALTSGIISGAVVLGGLGRVGMSITSLIRGATPGFSLIGTLEVLAVGTMYGLAGGLIAAIQACWTGRILRLRDGSVIGIIVFIVAAFTSDASRTAAVGLGDRLVFVLAGAFMLCILYGALAAGLYRRLDPFVRRLFALPRGNVNSHRI